MLKLAVVQVDSFTRTPFEGNPAAVVLDSDPLSPSQMLAIAREMNLSETVFVQKSRVASYRLRFFTPSKEVPLAGHPTIAAVHALVESGRLSLSEGRVTAVPFEFNVGVLPVFIEVDAGKISRIVMAQARPEFLRVYEIALVPDMLGISQSEIDDRAPVQTVSTGTPQLMVLVRSASVLERLRPDFRRLAALGDSVDFFSLHVFALEPCGAGVDARARHFAPGAGVNEDPVTGSASGGMGAYLVHYGLVNTTRLIIEQGHAVGRPGRVYVEVLTSGAGTTESVRVGGEAVTVMRGEIYVPDDR